MRSGSARASTDVVPSSTTKPVRIQRYLAAAGVGSRRACDEMVASGRVRLNGCPVKPGASVRPGADRVELDGRPVPPAGRSLVIAVNKPVGYLSACRRTRESGPLVTDLVPLAVRLYPAGRLDRDSEGLLVLTNCGDLAQHLMHPRLGKEKEYRVWLDRAPGDRDMALLAVGIELADGPARAVRVSRNADGSLQLVLTEGRKRQVRRMFDRLGYRVTRLQRTRIAGLRLGRLRPGMWRQLGADEVRQALWPGYA